MKKWLLVLVLVSSASESGEFVVYGSGAISCGKWSAARKTEDDWPQHGQWIQGYLVARAEMGANLQRTDQERINLWVDDYCKGNAMNDILDAARVLVDELEQKPSQP